MTNRRKRQRRRKVFTLGKEQKKLLFWNVCGVGEMTRAEFMEWSNGIEPGSRIVPPPYSGSDTPFGELPDFPPEVEQQALALLAEGLFQTLKASGHLRKLESKTAEMEKLVISTRELLREERVGASEQKSV